MPLIIPSIYIHVLKKGLFLLDKNEGVFVKMR